MITRIEVNGFKSLSQFELNLNKGLNILVGPNGCGKTNIILFFEFLSKITSNQIGYAVSSIGGAGSIFKKIGFEDYDKNIDFKIFGSKKISTKKYVTYEYGAKITTSFEKDNIFYSNQSIRLKTGTKFWSSPKDKLYPSKWDFDIDIFYVDNTIDVTLNSINKSKFRESYFYEEDKEKSFEDTIVNSLKRSNPIYKNIITSLFPIIEQYSLLIQSDLIGGETFNIVPTKVKDQEDASTPPGIKKDGSGLATTLYAMKKGKPKETNIWPRFFYFYEKEEKTFDPTTLKQIISYLKLANNTIVDLDVKNDPFDNKLMVKIYIKTGSYDAVLPLSAMSDGTIKWLALITAILTSKTIFSIEEPENFLHPWMQAEIASIMRNHITDKNDESFVIMTTHSESLLNYSQPNEIILISLEDGNTRAKRIKEISIIEEEISNSGYGLGHFYFSNALQNE
ncbi:ATP-binding protein [Flavobacterium sp. DG1-102-2]|uniref:AAA family ATPase n=1 Tax=Flavobacterium sp. DG1-102-2 TaxID=3081663 RepID=UPI0029492925|nr:ATP-binding protein [Flavobacterium sp. DG1-102-2]MDV6170182.1 ATP-binding protein [Flavobacterium sp. DG1-102-2]